MKIEGAGNLKDLGLGFEQISTKKSGKNSSAQATQDNYKISKQGKLPSALQVRYAAIFNQLEHLQNDYALKSSPQIKTQIDKLFTEMDNLVSGSLDINKSFIENVGSRIKKQSAVLTRNHNIKA